MGAGRGSPATDTPGNADRNVRFLSIRLLLLSARGPEDAFDVNQRQKTTAHVKRSRVILGETARDKQSVYAGLLGP